MLKSSFFKKGSSSSGNNSENVDAAGNVKKISVGHYQSGAITKDGSLYMWGQGVYVDGKRTTSSIPVKIMDNVKDVSLGSSCAAAIKEDGSLYVWGSTTIGDGVNTSSDKPIKIMDNVKSVTLGFDANAAITEDGSLYMWGVLDSNSNTVFSPKKIMDNVKDVSLSRQGDYYAAAITEDGSLYMFGNNGYGQLGNGTTEKSTTPIKIMDNVKSVDLGWHHSGAVTEDGSLYMWGYNFYGQLGNGEYGYTDADHKDMNRIISTPVKVMDNVEEVNLGDLLSSAITKDGSLYTWGTLSYNMVGYDEISNTSYGSPTPKKIMSNVNDLGFGNYHSVALTENGNVYTWGKNDNGQLGNGTTESCYTPTKINITEKAGIVGNIKTIIAGNYHNGAITEDGSLYTWGYNFDGQIGNGESGKDEDGKHLISSIPIKIMNNVKSVSFGWYHSGAVTEDGSLYMWGNNYYGQLGNGESGKDENGNERISSTPIKIMDNVKALSLEGYCSAAITEDGSLYTWGRNYSGQLGNGTICGEIITPTKIMDNVKSVSLGNTHSAAITEDGNLYTWGYNFYGQLGNGESGYDENGNEIISPTPIKIMGNVKTVSLGDSYSAVITEDGSLYTWGYNKRGQLGNGTNEDSATPIKIMDNVKAVSLGYEHSAAITEDGSLYMWGHNPNGQLGNGTTEGSLNPIKIMENVKSVSLGSNQSGAITEDGSLYMWGLNNCLLGNGTSGGTILTPVKINGISETVNLSTTYSLARNISVLANEETSKTENNQNTENTEKAKTFTDLEPNTVYNFYVMKSSSIENLLSAENLLYISQGVSDENGNLSVSYALTEEGENVEIFVKAMTDEDITSTEGVRGDANGDGKLNVRDAAFIASALAKGESDKLPEAADFNKDGKINVRDAAAIASFLAKKS